MEKQKASEGLRVNALSIAPALDIAVEGEVEGEGDGDHEGDIEAVSTGPWSFIPPPRQRPNPS